jgi:hypothetical protein
MCPDPASDGSVPNAQNQTSSALLHRDKHDAVVGLHERVLLLRSPEGSFDGPVSEKSAFRVESIRAEKVVVLDH